MSSARSSSRHPQYRPRAGSVLQPYAPRRGGARPRRRSLTPWLIGLGVMVLVVAAAAAVWASWGTSSSPVSSTRTLPAAGTTPPAKTPAAGKPSRPAPPATTSGTEPAAGQIAVASFLGGAKRNSSGVGPPPNRLRLLWRTKIGSGPTQRKADNKTEYWAGTGWTGQPTVVTDKGKTWLLIGGYDHNLHKIDLATGKIAWESPWPDVMKGTNTVVPNPKPTSAADRLIVVSGSRRGSNLKVGDKRIAPLRAVSFATGKELWRLPIPKTANYSQDVDSSSLWYQGALYAPVEPGYVYKLNPFKTKVSGGVRQPIVLAQSRKLYDAPDIRAHPDGPGANLAVEASASGLGDVIYISAGSGHIYGLDRRTLKVVWDFKTGSDIDGTPVIAEDGDLFVTIEKQYIKENGGVYRLDPKKPPAKAPVWYFPTPNRGLSEWAGGSVGSVAVNDATNDGTKPRLAAFTSVDGNWYLISQDTMSGKKANGPGPGGPSPVPVQVYKGFIGASIGTPAFVGDRIAVGGYDQRLHLYKLSYSPSSKGRTGAVQSPDGRWWKVTVKQLASYKTGSSIESTPLIYKGRVIVGSRDGYLYCFGL